jgi:hypothetical protein
MKNVKFDSYSQIDYAIIEFRRTKQQELLLNRGRLIYTKNALFGVNYSNSFQFDEVVSKFSSEAKSPGDQITSTYYNIEHPVVMSGQRSLSSSEDG